MRAQLTSRTSLSNTIVSFGFTPNQPFTFTAGQFIELTLPGHVEAGHPAHRWFTISSSPHESEISITTRVGDAAHTPFKRALDQLALGAEVSISEPMGDFVLPMLLQTPIVMVAGGIGITPFHSMLNWMSHTKEDRPVKLLYSVRTEDDIIFQDSFERSHTHATIVVEHPAAAWGGERGRLTAEMIIGIEKPTDESLFYLSGPEPFVQSLQADLRQHGVSNQQIVVDEFQGYSGI